MSTTTFVLKCISFPSQAHNGTKSSRLSSLSTTNVRPCLQPTHLHHPLPHDLVLLSIVLSVSPCRPKLAQQWRCRRPKPPRLLVGRTPLQVGKQCWTTLTSRVSAVFASSVVALLLQGGYLCCLSAGRTLVIQRRCSPLHLPSALSLPHASIPPTQPADTCPSHPSPAFPPTFELADPSLAPHLNQTRRTRLNAINLHGRSRSRDTQDPARHAHHDAGRA